MIHLCFGRIRTVGLVMVLACGAGLLLGGCKTGVKVGDGPAAGPRPPGHGGDLPPGHRKKAGGGSSVEIEVDD
jgi:hypothetical protein